MLLHLKKGAVVNLMVMGNTNYNTYGAIKEINDNEVIISLQSYVGDDTVTGHSHSISGEQIDSFTSVDYGNPIHIDKEKIFGWSYYSINFDRRTILSDCVLKSELKNYPKESIHHYEDDGICYGTREDLE